MAKKIALLTGTGRLNGIGAATAELLAKSGYHIIINCIKNRSQAERVVYNCKTHGVEAELVMGDISEPRVSTQIAQLIEEKYQKLDVLINCAAITKSALYKNLSALNAEDFTKTFAVNVTSIYLITQAVELLLRKSADATIINLSSLAGITGRGSSIAYAASKGAVNTLTLALARALAPAIRVNAICPSFVDSSWWEEKFNRNSDEYKDLLEDMRNASLIGKVVKSIDVAQIILSVIQNPVITGELITIDAGAHLK